MDIDEEVTAIHENLIRQKTSELHGLKDRMNTVIKELDGLGLQILAEVQMGKSTDGPFQVSGIELSVMQEIYP